MSCRAEKSMEEALDDCVEAVRAGKSPNEALARFPELASELAPMLDLVTTLEKLPGPAPAKHRSVELVRLGEELGARKAEAARKGFLRSLVSRPILARAAVLLLGVFAVGWTGVTVSADSVPGDLLYPLKLLTEKAKFLLTVNSEDRAELRIIYSEERLREFVEKHRRGDGVDKELLGDMLDEAKAALEGAVELPQGTREHLISRAGYVAEHQRDVLQRLGERVPPPEKQELAPYIATCVERCRWMRGMMTEQQSSGPSQERVRTWMRGCPMGGRGGR